METSLADPKPWTFRSINWSCWLYRDFLRRHAYILTSYPDKLYFEIRFSVVFSLTELLIRIGMKNVFARYKTLQFKTNQSVLSVLGTFLPILVPWPGRPPIRASLLLYLISVQDWPRFHLIFFAFFSIVAIASAHSFSYWSRNWSAFLRKWPLIVIFYHTFVKALRTRRRSDDNYNSSRARRVRARRVTRIQM